MTISHRRLGVLSIASHHYIKCLKNNLCNISEIIGLTNWSLVKQRIICSNRSICASPSETISESTPHISKLNG